MELYKPITQSILLEVNDTYLARILSLRKDVSSESMNSFWQSRFIARFGVSLGSYAQMSYYDIYRELVSNLNNSSALYLELLIKRGYLPLIEYMIVHKGIKVRAALQIASRWGNFEIIKMLLRYPISDHDVVASLHTVVGNLYQGSNRLEIFQYIFQRLENPLDEYHVDRLVNESIINNLYEIVLYLNELSMITEERILQGFSKYFDTILKNRELYVSRRRQISLPLFIYLFEAVQSYLFKDLPKHLTSLNRKIRILYDDKSLINFYGLFRILVFRRYDVILSYLLERYPEINQYFLDSVTDSLPQDLEEVYLSNFW